MINTQLGRRNLPPQQRIAVVKKFEKKIQEQAKITQGARTDLTSSPNGEKVITSTRTDKELAKLAGVGTGTVARFNKVMNSDDDELKKKVLANEVSINAGYEKVIETNIRQRGIGNPIKLGRCIKELEQTYGIEYGGDRKSSSNNYNLKTQSDIAEMIGISVDTLQNYKKLTELVPELQDWVETKIYKNVSYELNYTVVMEPLFWLYSWFLYAG